MHTDVLPPDYATVAHPHAQRAERVADLKHALVDVERERDALRGQVDELRVTLAARDARIAELQDQIAALKRRVLQQAHALYGRKTEQRPQPVPRPAAPTDRGANCHQRGQRRGERGHGRRRYDALPAVHVTHALTADERVCPGCGLPTYVELADEEISTELDWEVCLRRVVHHRAKYHRKCRCSGPPKFLTAAAPAKLTPKGLFTPRFVAHLAVEKFLLARPLHRVASALALEGADIAEGTLVGVLQRLVPMLEPLYAAICARNRLSPHLNVDETRWRRLWAIKAGGSWLWVFQGPDTTVYLLDQSRGHEVILRYLDLQAGEAAAHVVTLICDFMAAYDAARKNAGDDLTLELARCWAHYRRLILEASRQFPGDAALQRWAARWMEMVDDFFRLHRQRKRARPNTPEFEQADLALRGCVMEMEEVRERQSRNRRLPRRARSLLDLGRQHWPELTRCLDDLVLPADNNAAERALRGPVVCRKNFYGSGADWAARLTVMLWTVFATVAQNGHNPLAFLTGYLGGCAEAGATQDLSGWLPWSAHAAGAAVAGADDAQHPPGVAPG